MTYKDYTGIIEFDDQARMFHGEVVSLRDAITFQGRSVEELEKAMAESVDFYLAWCDERGETPEKPSSDKSMVRTSPNSTVVLP